MHNLQSFDLQVMHGRILAPYSQDAQPIGPIDWWRQRQCAGYARTDFLLIVTTRQIRPPTTPKLGHDSLEGHQTSNGNKSVEKFPIFGKIERAVELETPIQRARVAPY